MGLQGDGPGAEEEELFLREKLGNFPIVAIHTSADERYARLCDRPTRPMDKETALARDKAQVENSNVLGPIARANYTIINDGPLEDLEKGIEQVLKHIEHKE